MGLLEAAVRAEVKHRRSVCTAREAITALDDEAREELSGLVAKVGTDDITWIALAAGVSKLSGITIKGGTLSRHWRGRCDCDG